MTLLQGACGRLFPIEKGWLLALALLAAFAAILASRLVPTTATEDGQPVNESPGSAQQIVPTPLRQAGPTGGEAGTQGNSTARRDSAIWPPVPTANATVAVIGATSGHAAPGPTVETAAVGARNARDGVAASVIVADSRAFVERLYRNFFGLAGDPRAVDLWASLIDAGTITPEQAVESFLDSAHQYRGTAPVARLYLATFLRAPDFDGLAHWRDAILAGGTLDEIGERFARSPEFTDRYGALDDAGFIDQAFQNALGREPSDAERMQWRLRLGPGAEARGRMMVALSESEEFRESVRGEVDAVLLYAGLLGRAADQAGFAGWMGFLQEGNSRQALIRGFLTSSEFRGRHLAAGTGSGG